MANGYKMIDDKLVQLTDAEQKEFDDRNKAWADGQADRDLAELREKRNTLLSETDWTALGDVTMSDKMKTYRQELRDITKTFQSRSDKDFKFPDKPEE
tara:strand:- start:185 stop:478 length:294 start_codon:yes stop_codon:yes gene_type:complete